jgi:plastocyanin
MNRLLASLCSIVACGLVAAGCGSSNSDKSTSSNSSTKTQKAAPSAPKQAGKAAQVSMQNTQFNPKSLSVATGTTVTWTNHDPVSHDVTKTGGPGPNFSSGTGNLAPGATYKQTLSTPGTIKYVCTVHKGMTGTITVK